MFSASSCTSYQETCTRNADEEVMLQLVTAWDPRHKRSRSSSSFLRKFFWRTLPALTSPSSARKTHYYLFSSFTLCTHYLKHKWQGKWQQEGNRAAIRRSSKSERGRKLTRSGFENTSLDDICLAHTALFIYLHVILLQAPGDVTKTNL